MEIVLGVGNMAIGYETAGVTPVICRRVAPRSREREKVIMARGIMEKVVMERTIS